MEKLLIEVVNGIIDDTAYVYDSEGNEICVASGYDSFEAIRKVSLKLSDEIVKIKNNNKQIDFFRNIEIGTKVKYKDHNDWKYGYFAGVLEDRGLIMVSRLSKNDKFSGLKMIGCGMYEKVDAKIVELYEEGK